MNTRFRSILLLMFIVVSIISHASTLETYLADAEKHNQNGDMPQYAENLYKAGMLYWENSDYDNAITYFEKAVGVNKKIGNKNALLNLYTHIGTLYSDKNQLENALLEFRKSLMIREELGEKVQIVSGMLNVATVLKDLGRNYEAIAVTEKALDLSKVVNNVKFIRSCYGILAENHKAVGEAAKSMEYFNLYATFDKKIQNEEVKKKEVEAQMKVAIAEKQKSVVEEEKKITQEALIQTEANLKQSEIRQKTQDAMIQMKNQEIHERKLEERHQRMLTTFFGAGLCAVLLFSFIVFRGFKKIQQKNKLITLHQTVIEKKNMDIGNSLNYAKKIQRAMLLPQAMLKEYLPESFIYFRPREEVSGDFYYFSSPEYLRNGTICKNCDDLIISAIDCTGHGVPGAFMSMIGFNLLDQIIASGTVEPHQILDRMHDGVHKALKQDQTENKDGMDMALLRVKASERIVEFAGAKNPIIYIQNGELKEIKPDRFPIGGTLLRGRKSYVKHQIACPEETAFYIFSDGYQDQFGGADGRKFMTKKFKKLLLDIHAKPMDAQKEILNETLMRWKGENQRQIDDILVMGFRL